MKKKRENERMTKKRIFHTVLSYLACEHVILLDLAHLGTK